jgi:hypothetical protein
MRGGAFMAGAVLVTAFALPAAAQDGITIEAGAAVGQDVVPPDVIESGLGQDRLETLVTADLAIGYDSGPLAFGLEAGAEVFPSDSRYHRYRLVPSATYEFALSQSGRTRLRLGASYEYVFGTDGRVFDRARGDLQLIQQHSRRNTTVARLRYGYRNQTERRFAGFDQGEWLAELRHTWRPDGGSVQVAVLGLKNDADDDRFSYEGYGGRIIGSADLTDNLAAQARFSIVQRDYEGLFSTAIPVSRSDTRTSVSGRLNYDAGGGTEFFGEAGYTENASNVGPRRFDGFIGLIGLRWRFAAED